MVGGTRLGDAELDCESEPGTGHPVGAFGHPWGLDYTGTRGIISGRTAKLGGEMLQTDAPINQGNSGGPLISLLNGKIVGINTAKVNKPRDEDSNLVVPIAQARAYAADRPNASLIEVAEGDHGLRWPPVASFKARRSAVSWMVDQLDMPERGSKWKRRKKKNR